MTRALSDIVTLVGQLVPLQVLVPALAALALLATPLWLQMVRVRQIGGLVRRMVRADPDGRLRLADEVLALAGDRERLLVEAARQATRYDQRALRARALEALSALGARAEVEHLRRADKPPVAPLGHPLAVAANVERLLEQGVIAGARERLEEGLRRYPADPDLLALRDRLDAGGPP